MQQAVVICWLRGRVAHDLNLSQRSIEMHRSRVMEKMGASSVAQLVRMLSVESERREGPPPER